MCEVVIVYLYGSDTFIGLLSLALNHNATLAVVGHWDAYLGLRLTRKVLYCTLTSRPELRRAAAELLFHRDLYCLIPVVCRVSGFP